MGQAKARGTFEERVKQSVEAKGAKKPRMGAQERRELITRAAFQVLGKVITKQ